MNPSQLESITKATQCADLLRDDIREAHELSCQDNPVLEILLRQLLGDTVRLNDRLAEIELSPHSNLRYLPTDHEEPIQPPDNSKNKVFNAEVKGLKCRPCSKIGYKKCPKKHFKCMLNQDLQAIVEAFV